MPLRQDVQGGVGQPNLSGYQAVDAARAQLRLPNLNPEADGSAFWSGLIKGVSTALPQIEQQTRARAYLMGQQDSEMGKERQQVHSIMQEDYSQGYNRAHIGASLSKYQTGLQQKAVEYVNAGKSPDEWNAYVQDSTNTLLAEAGSQGLDLNERDWQSWLSGVQSTRDTAGDLYQTASVKRAEYMRQQSYAAEANAAVGTFVAADEAGNPLQALGNLQSYVDRVYNDPSMSVQERDGALASMAVNAATAAKSSAAVEALSAYFQELPQFKALPTDTQTQLMGALQTRYDQRASDESVGVYSYVSQVRATVDPQQLAQLYPMNSFISRLNEEQKQRRISPAQMFSMVEEENNRRLKLEKGQRMQRALSNGTTISDIATVSGLTPGKVKTALIQTYAASNGGYSGGGLALVGRGLSSGAADITTVGIEMLQQDAQSLGSIDPRDLKNDADGNPQYPATVANSLNNLKQAYDLAVRAGNQVQANQLIAGLPDAVAFGIQQNVDANSIADVVYRRAGDLAAGRVVALPAAMPKEMLATADDVRAGLFDTSLTQKGAARNILGIQSYIFQSKEDARMQESRLTQVNGAISEEYTSLYQQGRLPALAGDDLKNWLTGRVAARTVRVDDGTDAGSLLILPPVADKESTFGSTDNNIIGQAIQEHVAAYKQAHPGATTVSLRYDSMADQLVVTGTDKDNIALTTDDGIPMNTLKANVRSIEATLTSAGQGRTDGALAVPGAGFVKFDTANGYGVEPSVYRGAVSKLITYEGYTPSKGFSILGVHPTTGAKLNEDKYVKQPEDSAQVATVKLQAYLGDKVLPQVMTKMDSYSGLPEYLRQGIFQQLVETTYHAGNADAFGNIIQKVLDGHTVEAYKDFRESALYKDAGADSRRNKDRAELLQALSQYTLSLKAGPVFMNYSQ